jgi:integrator complex subunit 6
MIKPASIIVMTDGGKITSDGNIRSDIVIPGSTLPGSNFIVEPFRWDQRVFSLTMKFSAGDDVEHTKLANQPNYLAPLCDVTGGRSHIGNHA